MKIKVSIDPTEIEFENYKYYANGHNLGQSLDNLHSYISSLQNEMNIIKGQNILLTSELEVIKKEIYNYKFVMEMAK